MALNVGTRWMILMAGLGMGLTVLFGPDDPEAKRLKLYREDSSFCAQWATRREEARKPLAWTRPQGSLAERLKQEFSRRPEEDLKKELADIPQVAQGVDGRQRSLHAGPGLGEGMAGRHGGPREGAGG